MADRPAGHAAEAIDLAAIEARPTAFVPARGVALTGVERDALVAVVRAAAEVTGTRLRTFDEWRQSKGALRDALARFDLGAIDG